MYKIVSNHWPSTYNSCFESPSIMIHIYNLQRCKITAYISCCTYLSESRKGQTSGTGGVEGRSFASAMMCSKVMSVWVHTSTTWISWGGPWGRPLGVRLMTCTTTGSLAPRKASTVSSWLDLDNSFPFTWGGQGKFDLCIFCLFLFIVPFLWTVAIETFYGSRAVVEIDLSLLVQRNHSVQSQRTRVFWLSDIRLKAKRERGKPTYS